MTKNLTKQFITLRGYNSHMLTSVRISGLVTLYISPISFSTRVSFSSSCNLNQDDNRDISFSDMNPIVKYDNADTDKAKIFGDNRNKSGVYR